MMKSSFIKKAVISLIFFLIMLSGVFACRYFSPANENSNVAENTNSNANQIANKPINNANKPVLDNKTFKDAKLQVESDSLLKLFGNMTSVPVYVRDEPQLKTGSETQKGVAYTTCENKKDPTIYVKKVFYDKANPKMLKNIVKHELVHAWFCRQGEIIGHDERFRKKFKEIGGIGN